MALEEYRRKRNFGKTPEPAPGKIESRKRHLSYLVQKHDATRLHYDFRLEWNGVLLSWAVTKGPSLNPKDKRLAVRTEDHPLSYGTFEGTIPNGEYGGGTVMLWDTGNWEPREDPDAGLRKGHLAFTLSGKRLKGDWVLVRMRGEEKKENWLLIKESDTEARANGAAQEILTTNVVSITSGRSMEEIAKNTKSVWRNKGRSKSTLDQLMSQYPQVQLATLVDAPPEGEDWIHEIKFDGYRLLAFLVNGDVRLRTRNGKDWTDSFPAIVAAVSALKVDDAVIDIEAVVLDDQGKSGFQQLQIALGEGGNRESIVAFAFDLLHLNGESLVGQPLLERKKRLQSLLANTETESALKYSEHVKGSGKEMFANACEMSLEGVVSKEAKAPYVPGRQKSWLKSKCTKRQEFVILGYSDPKAGGRALGALYLGYRTDKVLRYAGKVGTGFTMKSARKLIDKFKPESKPLLKKADTPGLTAGEWSSIHWIKPDILCEVAFTEWTSDGRIRHPSFQGLRDDKAASEVKKEVPVKTANAAPKSKDSKLIVHNVNITHPERVISETGHITKGELAEYYGAVASRMLAQIIRRPLSLLRCPDGLDKQCFYQRSPGRGLGKDVHPFEFKHKGKKYEYLYIEDEKGLIELIQMGAIEIHPWGARIDSIDNPDRVIFDLDPAPDVPFDAVKLAAEDTRRRLQKHGLETNVKCTGGKGLHVWAPLDESASWEDVKHFASKVAHEMVEDLSDVYVATMTKAKRTGRIFVDFFRNDYTATSIADYAVRARPGAPVAVPLDWSELPDLKSADRFSIRDVMKRIEEKRKVPVAKPQPLPR